MTQKNYPIHPAAELLPPMTEQEFAGLKDDIQQHGQSENIVIWRGSLIDGRHRLRACLELNMKPAIKELSDDADPVAYVISHNLHRRHLSTSQRGVIAAKLANLKAGMNQHSINKSPANVSSNEEVLQNCSTSTSTSLGDAAALLNVSKRTVSAASFVQDHGCQVLNDAIASGTISASLAERFCRAITDPKEQTRIAQRGPKAIMRELRKRDAMPPDPPEEQARKLRSIIQQHVDNAVRALDLLHELTPNRSAYTLVLTALQGIKLWK